MGKETAKPEPDLQTLQAKIDELGGKVDLLTKTLNEMKDSLRIFKLNFQQTSLLRK